MPSTWKRWSVGHFTKIDWCDWTSRRDKSVDPYLIWADLRGTAGFANPQDSADLASAKRWPLIIELAEDERKRVGDGNETLDVDAPPIFGCLKIPGIYKFEPDIDHYRTAVVGKFVTASIDPSDMRHLMASKDIVRAQLGLPRIPDVNVTPVPRETGNAQSTQPRVVVGIIDDGFGFASDRLLDDQGVTRVRSLWDQDDRRRQMPQIDGSGKATAMAALWKAPDDLGYGAEINPAALRQLILRSAGGDAWQPYRESSYARFRLDPQSHSSAPQDADGETLPIRSMSTSSHGHSILDLAVGYPPLHRGQTNPLRLTSSLDSTKRADVVLRNLLETESGPARGTEIDPIGIDSADQWQVVLVQLPVRTVADTSGGSLAVHVLDGIRYILDRARRTPLVNEQADEPTDNPQNPVVINVSYGAIGGGHDGTSILEKAIVDLTNKQPTGQLVSIVLAAGNSNHDATHASLELDPADTKEFSWMVGPDNPLESYLEIWLPGADVFGNRLDREIVQRLELEVASPEGESSVRITADGIWISGDQTRPRAAVIYPRKVVQSEVGSMILIAVAPTRRSTLAPAGAHGEWTISVNWPASCNASIRVHAWAERADLLFGVERRQQGRVFGDPVGRLSEADPEERSKRQRARLNPASMRTSGGIGAGFNLGSLAGIPPARQQFALRRDIYGVLRGAAVVVSAHQINDGEVSALSSGGPGRQIDSVQEVLMQLADPNEEPPKELMGRRIRPDASAPGDLSASVPGVRVSAILAGSHARISATSAAAAQVTRAIANVKFLETLLSDAEEQTQITLNRAERIVFASGHESSVADARATLRPAHDDAFRNGRLRLR